MRVLGGQLTLKCALCIVKVLYILYSLPRNRITWINVMEWITAAGPDIVAFVGGFSGLLSGFLC